MTGTRVRAWTEAILLAVPVPVPVLVLVLVLVQMPGMARAGDELRFYTWADYLAPEVMEKFEKQTGVKITVVPLLANDEIYKGLSSGHSGFDLTTPVVHTLPRLIQEQLLERIDADSLDSYFNIEESWRSPPWDPNNHYSAPFHWGTTSFVVDRSVYDGDIDSYAVLFRPPPQLQGRISYLIGAQEVIQMGLMYLGLPSCSTDPAQLERVFALIRPQVNKTLVSNISTVIGLLSGNQVAAGIAWNGDALRARMQKPSLRYAYPREGVVVWADTLAVPKGAPHREAARAFIDFMLRPENAALQSNFTHYANAIHGSDAFLAPEIVDAPEVIVPSSVKLDVLHYCNAEVVAVYDKAYNQLVGYTSH